MQITMASRLQANGTHIAVEKFQQYQDLRSTKDRTSSYTKIVGLNFISKIVSIRQTD